tara:strand:- start:11 stop:310 length:300 start_codon:yes stop_codon:yes gene_type:complete
MTVQEKLLKLSRSIENQMHQYRNQLQDLMNEAEENEEEINISERGMYVNMVSVMEEIAPDAPCFYDVINTTALVSEGDRTRLDFFFDSVNDQLADELEA